MNSWTRHFVLESKTAATSSCCLIRQKMLNYSKRRTHRRSLYDQTAISSAPLPTVLNYKILSSYCPWPAFDTNLPASILDVHDEETSDQGVLRWMTPTPNNYPEKMNPKESLYETWKNCRFHPRRRTAAHRSSRTRK